jgi:cell division protein FtsZ
MVQEIIPLGLGEGKARPRLRALGIGGAGCNAIANCTFDAVALCNARDSFHSAPHHRRITLSEEHVNFVRSTSPRLLGSMDHECTRNLKAAVGESDLLFLFTGLGGETGSHLTPGIAHYARRSSGLVVVSAAMPFSVEGSGRRELATKVLPEILEAAHLTITYPNDGLLEMTPNLPLRRAFKVMDEIMSIPALELAQVITRDDITALRVDLGGSRHMRFGMGQGAGIRKEELAVADAFTSPWLNFPLHKVSLAIVIISGGEVDHYSVKAVMDRLGPRIPGAKIRYATKTDPLLGDKLRVMLLLSHSL